VSAASPDAENRAKLIALIAAFISFILIIIDLPQFKLLVLQMVEGEQEKAQVAQAEEVTIFDKIVKGEIPAEVLF
jgi:hypothetical protein